MRTSRIIANLYSKLADLLLDLKRVQIYSQRPAHIARLRRLIDERE